jgi:DNA-directed RNA polymerase specialized sigma24 family protein
MDNDNSKRVEVLHRKHRTWLEKVAWNITKDKSEGDDLISELYMYLLEKGSDSIYYEDSFNLMYCHSFIKTRWINRTKIKGRYQYKDIEKEDEPYDLDEDLRIQRSYDELVSIMKELESTKMWSSAKLASMYFFSDLTLAALSKEIGISKGTSFLNVKKIKLYLREHLENPFDKPKENG